MEKNNNSFLTNLKTFTKKLLKESFSTFWILFKIMLPVSIIVKILQEFDLIIHIGKFLQPFMKFLGLPGELGLVWATTMLANLFGGIIAFMNISQNLNLTIDQVTVMTLLMLVAHTLPIELQIASKSGLKIFPLFLFRFIMAIVLGFLTHTVYQNLSILQNKAPMIFNVKIISDDSLLAWLINEIKNYILIFLTITLLLLTIKILNKTKIMDLINNSLKPLLKFLGIGESVISITLIGLTLGIAYGGALIINEAKSGKIPLKDIFYSLYFMSICHSLIEDSLLMISIGGHFSGIVFGRIIFSIFVMYFFVLLTKNLNDKVFKILFLKNNQDGLQNNIKQKIM